MNHPFNRSAACALLTVALFACGPSEPPPKAIGEPCAPTVAPGEVAVECADGLCVALDDFSGFCTRTCTEDSLCPADYVCEAAGRYGKICKKLTGCTNDGECPAGHVCNADTGNCYVPVSRTLCSPCQDSNQCPEGGTCFTALGSGEQFCTGACGANDACPLGFECKDIPAGEDRANIRQCVPATQSCNFGKSLCTPCEGDGECGGFFDLCVRNVVSNETFCGRDCDPKRGQEACPPGFGCVDIGQSDDENVEGPFQCVPNSNSCAGYCDAQDEAGQVRQCGLGKECNLVSNLCAVASDGRQCAPCLTNDDCRRGSHPENRCISNDCADCAFKGESFCASPCADDAACFQTFGPGFVCKPVLEPSGATKNFCMPQRGTCASGLGRLGDDCSVNEAQDCITGVCLKAGNTSLCSLPCANDSQCGDTRYRCCEFTAGAGYDCSDAKRNGDAPISGSGVCAPLGGLFGDDCSPGRPPCQTGTCLDLGTARLCTTPCAAGCPEGFACRTAANVDGSGEVEICFPNGGGQAGADCTFGPAACESGLCIRKDSGSVCTQSCNDGDPACPDGWSCTQTATVDEQTVLACLPPSLQ